MHRLSRRTVLATGAAALLQPALASGSDFFDVIVVGAGAAGIAAARRIGASGRRVIVLEASDRIGGRCFTDNATFGVPYDRGAHWLYRSDVDPLVKLGRVAKLDVYEAPPRQKLRIGRRFARESEIESFFAALVRANRSFGDATAGGREVAAARALPKDLGEWRDSIEFALGPLFCGKELENVSARDLASAAERDSPAFCREGIGALLGKLAEGSDVRLATPVRRIATWKGISYVETAKGTLRSRCVIVTASTNALEKVNFDPNLPKGHAEAIAKLSLGHCERVAIELKGNPFGLERDDFVLEKANDARSGALLANVGGTPLCFVDLPGKVGQALLNQGEAAMRTYAIDWLTGLFGSDFKRTIGRSHATRWGKEQWTLGAFSAAAPGAHMARETLMEPVRERVFFAGEAVHGSLWGTVSGAWESGERAAAEVLKTMSGAGPSARRKTTPATKKPTADAQAQPERSGRTGGFFWFMR